MRADVAKPEIFLTAEWRSLVFLNYEVDPAILRPHAPPGTEIEAWQGRTFVSMVGFRFLRTRVLGLTIPFHRDFDEVNLRFYVRRHGPEGWRRGVVFVDGDHRRSSIAAVSWPLEAGGGRREAGAGGGRLMVRGWRARVQAPASAPGLQPPASSLTRPTVLGFVRWTAVRLVARIPYSWRLA